MNKKILFNVLILSFLALSFAKAQNIQFEDANFKAKLLSAPYDCLSYGNYSDGSDRCYVVAKDVNGNAVAIDTNGDGEISQAEALNIYQLDIRGANITPSIPDQLKITSLKGIEYFTNLTVLSCRNLPLLDNLDVSALTKLKELDCSMYVSGLYTSGWVLTGKLSNLILPKTQTLEVLHCDNTSISSLDFLAGITSLKTLSLDGLNLGDVSITDSQFPHLQTLSLALKFPDAVKNITVSDLPELATLYCGPLSDRYSDSFSPNISLSNLPKIEALKILGQNITINNLPNLEKLNCSATGSYDYIYSYTYYYWYFLKPVESLVLSGVPKLTEIIAERHALKTLDLSNVPNLIKLDCNSVGNNTLENIDLSKNINLQYLNLMVSGLKTLDLSKNINLQELYLDYSYDLQALDLSKNINLQQLGLMSTGIKTIDVSKNINLQMLDLTWSGIETLDVSHNINLTNLGAMDCSALTSLYMKNGVKKTIGWIEGSNNGYYFARTDNLNYICCDEDEIDAVKAYMGNKENLTVTSDCGNEDLEVSDVTENSAVLSWSAVAGATSYTVEYKKVAVAAAGQKNTTFADDWTTISGITATTYTLSGLADGSIYEWRLTAVGSGDETPVSGPFFTTVIKSMGTENLSPQAKVTFYPNPVKDVLYFSASGKVAKAEIYDLNGRLIKTAAVSNNSVNVSSLSKGVYFIILHTDKGVVKEKFIKN